MRPTPVRRPPAAGTASTPAPARRRGRRVRVAALLALAVLAPAACSAGATAPAPTPTVTVDAPVEPAKAAPPPPTLAPRWPLTGVETTEVAARPALSVKIENSTQARPQTGLEQADVVWEEVVEGGISRFVAVYHSQVPEEVGPIRSVRPMDGAINAPLGGLLAFSGGQPRYVQAIGATGVQLVSMDAGDAGFYRKRGVAPAPHNVYGTPTTFWSQADASRTVPPAEPLSFARTPEAASAVRLGTPATRVVPTFSPVERPSWDWDAASGTWLRSESGVPATARSGTRLAATNVVALSVQLDPDVGTDPAGNPVPETILAGSGGEGVLATGGRTVPVSWSKGAEPTAPLVLTTGDGQTATLAPGTTWIELVPVTTGSIEVG
ncbi:DUF3048 domain-containing protein [Cellulomonas marina]|uniref:DUF3048 domain-containing protein n=1 Tax=Cellulomonas marina TaxID=988821 RepID=A0A1I0XIW1_9CELL|nr:DUF3048 domain-containing protein [Cellulomonas marina]GIG30085.1 hypothetical protein Cma02nite_26850 [Cellulomonas marina]SFB00942.1 Protein of unknown function [Cellulomonas marina]